MKPNPYPSFMIVIGHKGQLETQIEIYAKKADGQFFFDMLDVEKRAENAQFEYWHEVNGQICFYAILPYFRKHDPLIHDKMGFSSNLKRFWFYISHNGPFEDLNSTKTLWLKTTGKTDNKYDNEYIIKELDKQRCYKIARFLRENDYKFSPALNDYLYLRCGIKFDLDLMDVEVLAFNDMKGQVYPAPQQ